jgi:hypothetical protein
MKVVCELHDVSTVDGGTPEPALGVVPVWEVTAAALPPEPTAPALLCELCPS